MRTPQHKFVVERKSGRRQQRAEANSIWGDTDLKAFVRKAEDDAPHLFGSKETSGSSVDDGNISPEQTNSSSLRAPGDDGGDPQSALLPVDREGAEVPKQHEANLPALDTGAQSQESQPVPQRRELLRDTPLKRSRRATVQVVDRIEVRPNEDLNARSVTASDTVSLEEVTALDSENKRLKSMLAEQLYAQNIQLRRMLKRFDVS
jgi:hypothetical protein